MSILNVFICLKREMIQTIGENVTLSFQATHVYVYSSDPDPVKWQLIHTAEFESA